MPTGLHEQSVRMLASHVHADRTPTKEFEDTTLRWEARRPNHYVTRPNDDGPCQDAALRAVVPTSASRDVNGDGAATCGKVCSCGPRFAWAKG